MPEFTVNQDVTAFVTHVEFSECCCNVYAQIGNATPIADSLADSIEEYISNSELDMPTQQWKEGDICLAKFHEDDVWYRARIRRKSGLLLTVFFIDYGNSDTVNVDCARKIPETLLTTPPLATTCIVSGCIPSGTAWTDAEAEKHRKTLENNEFKAKIISVNKSGKETALTIQLYQTDTGLPIFYSTHSQEANLENTGVALQNLEIGKAYKVFISHVESASMFWVQLTENERELIGLMSDIAACFADDSPSSGDIVDPQPGQICAMCYSEDGSFYRGMVKNVTNGSCNVIFIDYGNSETKPSDGLFTLPQPLCKLPAQAIQCSYHGSIDPSLAVHKLNELAAGESVIMKVVSKANHVYSVQIPSIETSLMISLPTESDANDAGSKSDGKVWLSYSPFYLQVGSVNDVCISCVDHPGCFFIQIIGNGPKLDELMQSLDAVTGNSPLISNCYIGLPCLAKFSDGVWYRAEVVSVDEENVQVGAVDFGFIEEFSPSQLRVIADKFKKLPAQSVHCTIDLSRTDESCWSRKDCEILTALTDKSALVAKVVAKKGTLYQLDLYETGKEDRYLNVEFSPLSSCQSNQELTNTSSPVTNQVKSSHQALSPVKEEMPHIPTLELHTGLQVEVCVTAVQFPYLFGQITSTPVEQVAKLQLDLNTFYEKNKVKLLPQNGKPVVPGTFCCAQYIDSGWYRAMVTRLQGAEIEVTFVDFGDIAVKSPQSLYILKYEFCKLAQQCIKCKIKNLPSNMTQRKMEDILVTQRLDVKLLTREDTVYPEFVVELPHTQVNRKVLDKLYEGQTQSPPRDAGRSKRSFGRQSSERDVEGYTHQEVRIGTTENVMVTHINDPGHFHCVLDGMSPCLDLTMDQLHEHYSKLQAGQEALSNPILGTPCVAQYSADLGWYRAKITGLLSNGLAEVMFVDYGNNECMSKDLLKAIKPEFMNLPAQAILCGLADVSTSQGFWSPEHIAQFEDLVLEQSFQATFKSHVARDQNQPYIVNLVNKKGEEISKIFGRSTDSLCVDAASSKQTFSTNNDTIQVNREGGFGQDGGRGTRGVFGQNRNDVGDGFGQSGKFNQDHKEGPFKRRHDGDEKGGFGAAGLGKHSNQSRTGDAWTASNNGNGRERSGITKGGTGHKGSSDDSSSDSSGFGSGRRQFGQRSDRDSGARGFGNKIQHSRGGDSRQSGFRNDRYGGKSDDGESNTGDGGEFRRGRFGGEKGGSFGGERGSFRGDKRGGRSSRGGYGDNRESGRGFGESRGGGRGGFSDRSERGFGGKSGGGFGGESGRGFGGKAGGGFIGKAGGEFGGTSKVDGGFGAANSGGDDWESEVTESKSQPQGFGVSNGGQSGGTVTSRGSASQRSQESWEGGGNTTISGLKITPLKQRFRGVSIKEEVAYVHYRLKLMETADVYVVYTDSPSEFWCQVVKNSTELQNLMADINEEYEKENLLEELQLKEPKPGMPCAAKFSDDNMWYRGEIKKHSTNGEEVHFVDYGNTETVCLSNIRKLKPKFLHLPTQGLKCALDKVSPSGGQWTDKAIEEFENLTADKKLFLKVLNTSADAPHMVILENQEENIDITQTLIVKGYCTLPTITAAKKIISSPYPGLNVPLGTTTDVYVSWIENPHRFWCRPVSEVNMLDKVVETLQEQYSSGIGANLTIQSAVPGMAVVSLFSEDGAWYRATVEAVAGDSVQVRFVDYGNTDTVKLESLRRITEDLLQIHSLAVTCKLTGIRPLQSAWTVDAKDIMKQLVEDKTVSCKVLDKEEDSLLVELMVEGTNMGKELIRAAVVRADKEPSSVIGSSMLKLDVMHTKQGMKRYPANSSLDIGSTYSGYVAFVESISSFWCQLVTGSDELDALMQKLESFHTSTNQSLDKPEVGSACVAKYSEDQAWYRGRVDKVDSEGMTVFFVDYGNKEVISPSDVCTIWDEFLTLPTQAIHCSLQLSNVKSSSEMSKRFEDLVMDQVLTIRSVKVNNDVYEIVLTLQDGSCVNDIFSSTVDKEVSTNIASKNEMISYPKVTYPTDQNIKVYLSYVESPSKFYVQLATQKDELNELLEKLKDAYSEEKQHLLQGMPGLACITKFSKNGEWYRAEVLELHDTTLKLRFVDYGNSEETSLDLVKILPSEFADIQPFAFLCCLHELDPIGEEWSRESITEFEALTLDKELTCKFNSLGQVQLQSEDGDIGEMLVNSGHAKWRTSSNVCALDETATSKSSDENLQLVREGEQALVGELLQEAESENSNEMDAVEELEEKTETEWTFLSEESQLKMVRLEEGQRQTVMVSHCESPSLFWIQLESNKPSIDSLLNSMYDAYSDQTLATLCVDMVKEGDLVVALYAEDESWYRARVVSVASEQEVEVFFMDYGNSEIVSKDSLRKFMAQFSVLPIQGLICSLSGVNPKGNSWSDETIDLFTELTQDKALLMEVLSVKGEVYQVELMNMGLSISQQLIDQGGAVEKLVPLCTKRVHQLFASDSSTPSKLQKENQFRYKELDLDAKSGTFEVLLSHLTNPVDFWCQKWDNQKGITELNTRIQDSYSSDSETITDIITYLGCVVLNTEDNTYYRGVVQKVNDQSVIVLCIDNGSEIQVPSENVKKLKPEFMDLPQQAFHCGLSDIMTNESLDGIWDVGACSRFRDLVCNMPLTAELARQSRCGKYLLKLYDGDVSIAQALVDGGYAKFRGALPVVDKGGYKQLRLEVDDEYEVTLVDNDEMDQLVFHAISQLDVIKDITERVAETVREMEKIETELNEGDLCLVRNRSSNTWYRGIVQVKADGQYEIYTLDYGSLMTVVAEQIMPLTNSLASVPAQALICSMEGITPEQNTSWTEESLDFFKDYCSEGQLFLYVTSYEDGIHEVVLSKEEAKGSVNALLVDLGFAAAIPGSDIDLEVQEEHGEESFIELSLCRANSLGSINEETTTDHEEITTDLESNKASKSKTDVSDDGILTKPAVLTPSKEDLDLDLKDEGAGSFSNKLEASTPCRGQKQHIATNGELNSEEVIDGSCSPLEQDYRGTVASTLQDTTDQDSDIVKTEGYEKCPDFGVTKELIDQGETKDLDQDLKKDLDQGVTKEDLDQGVTKEDLDQGVTKEDLDQFVTKEDLDQGVTKEDLDQGVTKDLDQGVTKEDLDQGVTKEDLDQSVTKDLDQGVTKEDLDQGVTKEDLDQGVTKEDLDQGVMKEDLDQDLTNDLDKGVTQVDKGVTQEYLDQDVTKDLDQGVTKEYLDQGVTKEYLDQDVANGHLEECVTKDHKQEFPDCKADTDKADQPNYSEEDRGKQTGDNVMQVELIVGESQDSIKELENGGQQQLDIVLTESVAAINDKIAEEGNTEEESKAESAKDIIDQSTINGTEDDGNRMGFVDVCPGIVMKKVSVLEDPRITNMEKENFENTPSTPSQNGANINGMQSTGTGMDREENSESWFDAKEG
ncbi:hypothetical protein ACJMK2_042282 [Sinanodonta woodiana]|uniref:Tudor domain-containing protein n=1 Tax=Sinanodonta woodiana TaxID=1069815 RepID=A0ABD3WA27_SINWO